MAGSASRSPRRTASSRSSRRSTRRRPPRPDCDPGDLITKVDGQPTADFTLAEIVTRLRGDIGSKVVLTLQRIGRDPFEVTLRRAEIKIKSVKGHLENGGLAYIRVSSFIENTDDELRATLRAIERQAAASDDPAGRGKLTGLVLDLRNDPGGLVDQAVAVAGDFLDKGEIVSIRGRRPDDVKRYGAKPGDITHEIPIVVLINGGSASASEIVAGALRDDHRAVLLGSKSFGKGSVQTIIPMPGHGALRLTTARYFTPSGRSIQAEGIVPDIEVEPARIERIKEAMTQHEADLRGALKNPNPAASAPNVPPGATPAATRNPAPSRPRRSARRTTTSSPARSISCAASRFSRKPQHTAELGCCLLIMIADRARTRLGNGILASLALPSLARAGVQLTRGRIASFPRFGKSNFPFLSSPRGIAFAQRKTESK